MPRIQERLVVKVERSPEIKDAVQMPRCSDLRTSGVVLENIADLGSDYLRTKRPLGSHYLRMSAH